MIKDFLKILNNIHKDNNLSLEAKHLLTILIKYHNHSLGYAFPSYENLMEECSTNRKAKISKILKELKEMEYITVKKIQGNKSIYYINKYLHYVENEVSTNEVKIQTPDKEVVERKEVKRNPLIVSDCKESGVQIEIEEVSEYAVEHQQKISLVLKQGVELTEKQMFLIGDLDLETLRKAIRLFKKKKGRKFALLINLYLDIAEKNNIEISRDIERYLKGTYIRMTPKERETQQALRELELYGVPYVV